MVVTTIYRAGWHAFKFGWKRTVINSISIAAVCVLYVFHWTAWVTALATIALSVSIIALSWLLPFFYYLIVQTSHLEDPLRTLGIKRRRRITRILQSSTGDGPARIVWINCYPRVRDARGLRRDIREALEDAGWGINMDANGADAVWEPKEHAQGIWVYGQGKGDPYPPTGNLLQEALQSARLPVHIDAENYGEQQVCLVIGSWETPWVFCYAAFRLGLRAATA
jgi:hypothetical protein